jgi:hypothetical protein
MTARLFGPDDWACVTVIVLVEVFIDTEVDVDVILATEEDKMEVVVEIGTADMTLLLMEIAGAEEKR